MTENVSPKRAEVVTLIGLVLQLVFSTVVLVLAFLNSSAANRAEAWHFMLGIAFWAIVYAHVRQRRLAKEEQLECEELEKTRKEAAAEGKPLFEGDELESYSARGRLKTMEKWAVPIISVIISAGLIYLAIIIFTGLYKQLEIPPIKKTAVPVSFILLAIITFVTFLFSKYAAGMAAVKEWRLLRAGASYMMSNAVVLFATLISIVGAYLFGWRKADRFIAYAVPVVMMLLGFEVILNVILDFYRPRIAGQETRPPYDSRMLSLLTEPGGILRTAAQTLDYQFGFKVSETWFYRFLEKAIAPLILFQLLTLYLLTCFVVVRPDEQAIIERFGRPPEDRKIIESGLHMKLPWPLEKAYRYPAKKMLTMKLGYKGKTTGPILWTVSHYEEEFHYLVATRMEESEENENPEAEEQKGGEEKGGKDVPVNLADIAAVIYYEISDLYDYAYNHYHDYSKEDPAARDALLQLIGERELARYMVNVDILDVMTVGKDRFAEELERRIQKEADDNRLGVRIKDVAVQNVHPPVTVGLSYEAVLAAEELSRAAVLEAKAHRNRIIPRAEREAQAMILRAEAYKTRNEIISKADADRFGQQLMAYKEAPEVFKTREFLNALLEGIQDIRKFVIPFKPESNRILIMDTKETVSPGVLGLDLSMDTLKKERIQPVIKK